MPIDLVIPGHLVALALPGRARPLDGFWSHGPRRRRRLLLFVHGMGSNFYRSGLKKALLRLGPRAPYDVLAFNNRGAEQTTATERFTDCLADIDAAVRFGRAQGYREFILAGHSTGGQKIIHWQARRQHPQVRALVLLAVGDDYAILQRDLGRRLPGLVAQARRWVRQGRGEAILPTKTYEPFGARRFLSLADPRALEAQLFRLDGPLRQFRRLRGPVLALIAGADEYATLPPAEVVRRLSAATRSGCFEAQVVPGADHGFHGDEARVAAAVARWVRRAVGS